MNRTTETIVQFERKKGRPANQTVLANAAHELVFAVVGHVGSGTTSVAKQLEALLLDTTAIGDLYEVSYIKATDLIRDWGTRNGKEVPEEPKEGQKKTKAYVTQFQNLGDAMRLEDHAAVAKAFCLKIRLERAKSQRATVEPGKPLLGCQIRRAAW